MGDARASSGSGVYALQKDSRTIVGMTMCFKNRVKTDPYSASAKVLAAWGASDQQVGRNDFILFDLEALLLQASNPAWLARGLETLAIVAFGTAVDGLNSRVADNWGRYFCQSPQHLEKFWAGLQKIVRAGHKIPGAGLKGM